MARSTLLLVNPNSSKIVTDRLAYEAPRIAPSAANNRGDDPLQAAAVQALCALEVSRTTRLTTIAANGSWAAAIIAAFCNPEFRGSEHGRGTTR
jgi:hypothetical protein